MSAADRRHPRHRLPALRRARGWAAGTSSARSTCTACAPRSGSAAAPRRRSSRGWWSASSPWSRSVLTAVRSQIGELVVDVRRSSPTSMSWLVIFFVAVVAPGAGLPGPAQRGAAAVLLPAAAAAPTTRWPSWPALVTALWLLLGGPQLLMFLGARVHRRQGMRGVWHELLDLLPGLRLRRRCGGRLRLDRRCWSPRWPAGGPFAAGGIVGGLPDDHPDRRRADRSCRRATAQRAGRRWPQPIDAGQRRWASGRSADLLVDGEPARQLDDRSRSARSTRWPPCCWSRCCVGRPAAGCRYRKVAAR